MLECGVRNADAGTDAARELVGAADWLVVTNATAEVGWTGTCCAAALVEAGTANIPVGVAAGTRSEGAEARMDALAGSNAATLVDAGTAKIPVGVAAGTRSEGAEAVLSLEAGTANIPVGVAAGTRSEGAEAVLGIVAESPPGVLVTTAPPAWL